jgi:2'-5' RNA ligase
VRGGGRDIGSVVLETALVVTVDAPPLEALYREAYPGAVARGIPLHITVLYPFVPVAELGDDDLAQVRAAIEPHPAFDFALARVETFVDVVWLAPEPVESFRALLASVHRAFPAYPPYGGLHDVVIPHATLTTVEPAQLDTALATLRPRVEPLLPLAQRADALTLLVEEEPDRWRERLRITLPQ